MYINAVRIKFCTEGIMEENRKKQLLLIALEKLKEKTGFIIELGDTFIPPTDNGVDGQFRIKANQFFYNVDYVIQEWFALPTRFFYGELIAANFANKIILTLYVNKNLGERLKALDIQFLDTAGHAYIRTEQIFIFITGNKPTQLPKRPRENNRIFNFGGLKIIFALFCDDALINFPYRKIAERTGVANGTVLCVRPEHGFAAIDVFTCGNRAMPEMAVAYIKSILQPASVKETTLQRGTAVVNDVKSETKHVRKPNKRTLRERLYAN